MWLFTDLYLCVLVAFVGKLSFADVVKSPAPPVRVLMSRENLPAYQPPARYALRE